MIYKGTFVDIKNQKWTVEFITGSTDTTTNIILSTEPVVIKYEPGDNLFKPLKLSSATVRCWVDDYMFDLFSGEAKGTKCNIYKGTRLYWSGYVTPNIYSQPYEGGKFELEIECYDGLSVLQYMNYEAPDKTIISFSQIIINALKATGCNYDNIYIPDFSNYPTSSLYISEYNFFDEDGAPMKIKEVLEHILTYLNLTMYQQNNNVYIVDYNNLHCNYYVLDIRADYVHYSPVKVTLDLDDVTIYRGGNISLTEVYNKLSIRSSLYNFDSYVPDPTDPKYLYSNPLYSAENNAVLNKWTYYYSYLFTKAWKFSKYNINYIQDNSNNFTPTIVFGPNVIKGYNYEGDRPDTPNYDYLLAFRSSVGTASTSDDYLTGPNQAVSVIGGHTEKKFIDYNEGQGYEPGEEHTYTHLYNDDWDDITHNPFVAEVTTDYNAPFYDGYLQLKFDTLFSTINLPYPNDNIDSSRSYFTVGGKEYLYTANNFNVIVDSPAFDCSVVCKLQIGDYFWNGSAWTTTDSNFLVPIGVKGENLFHKWHKITDTNTVINGDDKLTGYVIPVPDNKVLIGKIKFQMTTPRPVRYGKIDWYYSFIKDFILEFIGKHKELDNIQQGTLSEYEKENIKTDEIWENVINGNNVSEFNEIDLKVCTNTNKGLNFGAVLVKDGTDYQFLNTVIKGSNTGYMEEHLLNALYNQLSTPKKSIAIEVKQNVDLNTLVDSKFVLNSAEYNLGNATTTLNLLEL